MADGKLDLPDDLLSSKTLDQHRSVKDEAWCGTGDEKSAMGLLDESKVADQATSDSSIPLSPQWLYAKPIDAKTSSTGASGEMRAPNSLPHGNITDPNLKDSWRLDGSQDKKDWRKIVPDVESNRRWREEERETGLLGRRDRKKEDRRADALSRDMSENRPLSSTDRWHDSRRDSKWTSRWGPEDKDKDSRNEKRTDAEKEDIQIDRQSFVSGNRPASERDNDSRDKWRPRHRMEAHTGSAAYRSAPGFGPERGRMEGSNVRFAAGRGRSANNGIAQVGRSLSVSVIGSVSVDKLCGSSAASTYCYPRGKLLDIYRKHKTVPSFDAIPDEMEHVSPITQVAAIEPLAFVAPDAEEEAVLWDTWKGKIRSSGVLQNSFRDKNVPSNDDITGFDDMSGGKPGASVLSEETIETVEKAAVHNSSQGNASDSRAAVSKERNALIESEGKFMSGTTDAVVHDGSITSIFDRQNICSAVETRGLSNSVNDLKYSESQQREDLIMSKHSKLGVIEPVTSDVGGQLPDDSSSLFDFTSLQKNSSSDQLHLQSNDKAHSVDFLPPEPEDLSLFYLDPQGEIQGPYMGIDIIMWFEQGYFGTDLPVRLSDAPAGSAFQELGEIMPHLKFKAASAPVTNLAATSQLSDAVGGSLEDSLTPCVSGSDFKGPAVVNDQQWVSTGFEAMSGINYHSRVPNENKSELHYADDKSFQNFVAQDEEIVFPGRPASSSGNQFRKSATDIPSSISSPASHHSLANEFSETGVPRRQDDDKLHPFGLLMSELKDSSHLRRTQSSNMASGIGNQDQVMDSLLEREATFVNQSSFRTTADQPSFGETLSDDCRRNTHSKQNIHQGTVDTDHLFCREQKLNGYDLGEHIISQKLQNELQHHNLLSHHSSHATGLGIEEIPGYALAQRAPSKNLSLQRSVHPRLEMEQLLELQFPQQRHLEFQQQRHLELQQQRHLELQQQRHLELQQQRHLEELQRQRQLEELKQRRQLEELQQRRQLEELQQRRHLEELQQRHLEELQQQRHLEELQQLRHFELQQQRHLELQQQQRLLQHQQQQQQRLNQMKLLQQQQQQQVLLEQLFQHQMSDPVYGQLKADTMRDNPLDQVQLRMNFLHELQQNFQTMQLDPSMEQIIQAKIGQNAHRGQPAALLDLISPAKHGNMPSSEQQLHFQQDPLQGRQLSLSLRQQLGLEGERLINGPWSVDEAGQFFRNPAGHHHVQSAGLNSSDFYQQQRRLSSPEEQFDPRHWNPAIQEQHQLGFFEPSSTALDRSMNLDNVDACGQVLDFPDQHLYMHSSGELGSLSSGVSSHSRQLSNEFYASYPDMIEHHSQGNSGLLESNWIEKHIQQLNLKAEQQRKESEINMNAVDSIWTSARGDEENSKRALMDHFHQNLGHKSMQSSEVDYQHLISSSKTQETVWPVSETHSLNLPFGHLPDQEVSESSSFMEGPQNSNTGAKFKHAGNSERLILRSSSGAPMEQSFLSGIVEHPNSISKSAVESELQGLKGKRHGSKGMSWSVSEIKDNLVEETENSLDCREQRSTAHSRQSSLSTSGGNGGYDIGSDKSVGEVSNDRLPSVLPKGLDNDWNKRPPVTRVSSSQDEPTAAPLVKQKSSASLASDEGKRESVNNPVASRVSETGKKDLQFRRTSSCSDAAVSETSFMDMLKKPVHPEADPSNGAAFESSDGAPTGRSGKKKGKKGRQIDPALLGFKVSSNRIMMGEIQRLED